MIRKIFRIMIKKEKLDLQEYSYQPGANSSSYSISRKKNKLESMPVGSLETLNIIRQWRQHHEAPVDVVGCERLSDQKEPIEIQKYQTLVALMLSVQTKDETTAKVMQRLKKVGLRPQFISKLSEESMVELIFESNFNRRKAKNILAVSERVARDGMPNTKEGIMDFPGVGVKIATIYMRAAEGVNDGIGVDVHVHRIANRLGWVKTKNPNETEQELQKIFPSTEWDGINITMVGFGQIQCGKKKPKCGSCPVATRCPSFQEQF